MSADSADEAGFAEQFEREFGHRFADRSLLRLALSHRSWVAETGASESNERLEFLGDAVLGLVVADLAFREFPAEPESALNDIRKAVVNERALADLARELGLGQFLLLGRGEDRAGGRDKNSILADAMEAVIGAVYLDAGTDGARRFVERHFADLVASAPGSARFVDHKSALQEMLARSGGRPPRYETVGAGPDHDRIFTARVYVDGTERGRGTGATKREAEQDAAGAAVTALGGD